MLRAKIKHFFHNPHLTGVMTLLLLLGTFVAVMGAQQTQDSRSRAAGIYPGDYNGTLRGNYFVVGGGVSGDVIGNGNVIEDNIQGCLRGDYNVVGGRVYGGASGRGNVIAGGSGSGGCLSESSPTPTRTPTPVPPTPTKTPMPTSIPPTSTPKPTQTPSPTPTTVPVLTLVPSPTPTIIPPTVQPTATPSVGDTSVAVTLLLHGIGNGGDSANPNSQGNMNPLRPQRSATVYIYDVQNQLILSKDGVVTYNASAGNFTGKVSLGTQLSTGYYTVKIKADQYLRDVVSGIQTITEGQTYALPSVTLIVGDANDDNQINIIDYNLLVGCYSDLLPAIDCTPQNKILTDFNDDGNVNQSDYNLFLRELTNIGGQ